MSRCITLTIIALLLAIQALPAQAQEPTMPGIDQALRLDLRPGETLTITTTFEAGNENRVDVYLHQTRQLLICSKSHPGCGAPTAGTYSYTNTSQEIQSVLVAGFHKNTPPRGGEPWHLSRCFTFINEPKYARLGWEDGGDNDYNDAMADIRLTGP
jgi:hypothetical protein